ncbi:hypothetical protein CDAR_443231 [Caerostris darwini]|uniref:Uncharacterized protein n=1 Tax=Caerostris darwini TaxID=1538125 RepID=A0AAV4MIT9_9ARAC|nr:hypothetical protein CDAR_443231 [Caerostris darwini]
MRKEREKSHRNFPFGFITWVRSIPVLWAARMRQGECPFRVAECGIPTEFKPSNIFLKFFLVGLRTFFGPIKKKLEVNNFSGSIKWHVIPEVIEMC